LTKTQIININDHEIQIRRLLNPTKRIVISNVCPSIPNHIILHSLNNLGISSQINYLKAGVNLEGYEHILSFHKQVFIKHEDMIKLPGSLILNHNQSQSRIFFTDDTTICYTCKTTGHTAQTCKRNVPINTETPSSPFTSSKNIDINISTSDLTSPPTDSDQVISQTYQHDILQTNEHLNEEEQPPKPPIIILVETNSKTMEADTHEQYIITTPQTMYNSEQLSQTVQTCTQNKNAISDTSSQMSPHQPLTQTYLSNFNQSKRSQK